MKRLIFLFVAFLMLSSSVLGQNKCIMLEQGPLGDTILSLTIPEISFNIDCDRCYRCIVGCEVSFATDKCSRWILDSFLVERLFINQVYEINDDDQINLLFSKPNGCDDFCGLFDSCWSEKAINNLIDHISSIVKQGSFNSQRSLNMYPSKIMFHWVENINKH